MAVIVEKRIVVTMSKLVPRSAYPSEPGVATTDPDVIEILADDNLESLRSVVEDLLDDKTVVVEIEYR